MTAVIASPGRLERRKARTRASIVSAASKLFHERGFEETSIQHIAELADTGVGTLYGYFESKDDILREVLQAERDEALERYFAAITPQTSHIDRTVMALQALADYLKSNRTILTAAFQVSARNRSVDEAQAAWLHASFREMVQGGITAGEFRELPVDTTVRMLIGTTMLAMLGIGNWGESASESATLHDLEAITRSLLLK